MTKEELKQSYLNSLEFYEGQLQFIQKELDWVKEQIKLDKQIGYDNSKLYSKIRRNNYKWRKYCKQQIKFYSFYLEEVFSDDNTL